MPNNFFSDDIRQYLSFIQGAITRMNSNSFSIKGWMIAIVSALCAVYASNTTNPDRYIYFIIAIIATVIFWCIDAYYLKLERQYRDLYDAVLKGEKTIVYDMNVQGHKQCFFKALFCSWSTIPLYLPVIIILSIALQIL